MIPEPLSHIHRSTEPYVTTMIECLKREPHTLKELAAATGLHIETIGHYIARLHRAALVHVASWGQDERGRTILAQWSWGKHPDAIKQPKYPNNAARLREYRKAVKVSQ